MARSSVNYSKGNNRLSTPIAVLGAGSWGTALAILLARNQQEIRLWGWDKQAQQQLQHDRCNSFYLPNIIFPDNLIVCDNLAITLEGVHDILIAVPSRGFRETCMKINCYFTTSPRIAWATKGLDVLNNMLLHEVVQEIFGNDLSMAVLSGPSFAQEVAAELPTAISLASNDSIFARDLITRLHNDYFRVYASNDLIGVELGGAVKNVLAIAVGIADGLGFGANTRCALITRGLAEMVRLGLALGGKPDTFMGLAGVGDLILTCTDNQSRNRRLGLAIGSGKSLAEAEKAIGYTVEGVSNAHKIFKLAQHHHVDMPITEHVCRLLVGDITPQEAATSLMSRQPENK